jgi:hypothetical protein
MSFLSFIYVHLKYFDGIYLFTFMKPFLQMTIYFWNAFARMCNMNFLILVSYDHGIPTY